MLCQILLKELGTSALTEVLFFVPERKDRAGIFFEIIVSLPNFGNFAKINGTKMKNTSVALGSYFDDFIKAQIAQGRYNNASEVIRAGLRLLEDNESQVLALKKAIQEGLDSGIAEDFDPAAHLKTLKSAAHNG